MLMNETSKTKKMEAVIVNPVVIRAIEQAKLRITKITDNALYDDLKNVRFEVTNGDLKGSKYMVKCTNAGNVVEGDLVKVKITGSRPYANVTPTFTWLNPSFTGSIVTKIKGGN